MPRIHDTNADIKPQTRSVRENDFYLNEKQTKQIYYANHERLFEKLNEVSLCVLCLRVHIKLFDAPPSRSHSHYQSSRFSLT